VNEAFAPPGERWVAVSPRLRTMRRTVVCVVAVLIAGLVAVACVAAGSTIAAVTVAVGVLAVAGLTFVVIGRNYRSWGYAERADDLLVTHGVLVRRLVVVPYGRMQLVDVTAGPLERKFGISTLRLHTASAGTDARIHGLEGPEAARLRDRLAALGESQSAGL
jgi:uncharacterized protein